MTSSTIERRTDQQTDWVRVAAEVGPGFGARATAHDANDEFAAINFQELREQRLFGAGIPTELGGGGASHGEMCAVLRELGRHCGATALAFGMHAHLVAGAVFQYRQGMPTGPLLERVAAEQLMLCTSGASDWLDSSGTAERVDGGFRVNARKRFVSGSLFGDLILTSAIYEDPAEGPTVLNFATPLRTPGITVIDNWRTMAMRASGSNDVEFKDVFIPDEAVSARKPTGAWAPFFNVVAPVALPMILSAYLGVADAARSIAEQKAHSRSGDETYWYLLGELENAHTTAVVAIDSMIEAANNLQFVPEIERTSAAMVRKTIAADALLLTVEKALEIAGGSGIFRSGTLERLVRDMHAVQFHPLQAKRQMRFTGRVRLGLDPVG